MLKMKVTQYVRKSEPNVVTASAAIDIYTVTVGGDFMTVKPSSTLTHKGFPPELWRVASK